MSLHKILNIDFMINRFSDVKRFYDFFYKKNLSPILKQHSFSIKETSYTEFPSQYTPQVLMPINLKTRLPSIGLGKKIP